MTKENNDHQPIDRTELVWPGKRQEAERVELPFQTSETINLPRGYAKTNYSKRVSKKGEKSPKTLILPTYTWR